MHPWNRLDFLFKLKIYWQEIVCFLHFFSFLFFYNDCKLSNRPLTFNLCCCRRQLQLAPFPMTACRPLTWLVVKRAKLEATILLPLETRKVARGNIVILTVQNIVTKAPSCLTQLIIGVTNKFICAVLCCVHFHRTASYTILAEPTKTTTYRSVRESLFD